MKILEALLKRRSGDSEPGTDAEPSSPDDHGLPIPGYDRLGDKEIADRLSQLSQVELTSVEAYERAHEGRQVVLDKLRYMRGGEPMPGYDLLETEQVVTALAGADARTVKAVRDYERKFRGRKSILVEAARVLPTSPANAGEEQAHERKAALLREGYADRARRTATDPSPDPQ
jgi:hypothetical protein